MVPKLDPETAMEAYDLRSRFPRFGPGGRIAETAVEQFLALPETERPEFLNDANAAAAYLHQQFRDNAFVRDGDLGEWFSTETVPLRELARRGRAARVAHQQAEQGRIAALGEEAFYALEEQEEAARERDDRLENEGYYGRTHSYETECDQWIYLRFGPLPVSGRSQCGLIGEDTEDGPDEWRIALNGMTHEAGICVLRAYRHPDVENGYVLVMPDFEMALYGVSGSDSYLNAIIPSPETSDPFVVQRLDGSLVTNKARDGTIRIELGSDGEYMLDPRRAITQHPLAIEQIYVHEAADLRSFLLSRRGIDYAHRPSLIPAP